MRVEFHDSKGRVEIEEMTSDGIYNAKYLCEQMLETLEEASRKLDIEEGEKDEEV